VQEFAKMKVKYAGLVRPALLLVLGVGVLDFMPDRQTVKAATASSDGEVKVWVETSLHRVFPNSPTGERQQLDLIAARNQALSFQACVRNTKPENLHVQCSVSGAPDLQVIVRRVGYVPLPHRTTGVAISEEDGLDYLPGMVPDPLFPEQTASVGPWENQSFWITVTVPTGIKPGLRLLNVVITSEDPKTKEKVVLGQLSSRIDVRSFTIQPRHGFPVTHWWQPDALFDYYKTKPFSEKWWQMAELYLRDMTVHGSNVIMVPVFHTRREVVQRPPQLLKVQEVSPGKYEFDFSDVHRFIAMAKRSGMQYFEFPHLWLYWGVRNPIHVYRQHGDQWSLLWPTDSDATTGVFRIFLEHYLPALRRFLAEEGLPADHCFFHVSDEPGSGEQFENYKKARALLKELAPWMKVMDALSTVEYGMQGVTDIPVPILQSAQAYIDAGIPHWVYFCTVPRGTYLNRLFDTPLAKIRMSGWLFYRLGANGFLHWGYNYWYKMDTQTLEDVFQEGAGGAWPDIPYGDPFEVYPGPNGPIDSIRWEVFAESLQDYAILQTAGVSPKSPMFSAVKSYDNFPEKEEWIDQRVREILSTAQ
jgi:hypothetical protein